MENIEDKIDQKIAEAIKKGITPKVIIIGERVMEALSEDGKVPILSYLSNKKEYIIAVSNFIPPDKMDVDRIDVFG